MKKRKLTLEEYVELGREYKKFKASLSKIFGLMVPSFYKTGKEFYFYNKIYENTHELCSLLEEDMFRDYNYVDDSYVKVFYGKQDFCNKQEE